MGKQFFNMTKEELSEAGRRGGIKAGEVRRRKRDMKEATKAVLSMALREGKLFEIEDVKGLESLKGKNISTLDAIIISQVNKALRGDTRAAEWVRDTAGMKPTDSLHIDGVVNNPFEGMSTEELRELVDNERENNTGSAEGTI